mgnify:CR=1 FL=1
MGILSKIFTWWDGATIGTHLWASRVKGEHVGTDASGNKYYRAATKDTGKRDGSYTSREKRWVIYAGVGAHYAPFAPLGNFPYEFRKDLLVYAALVARDCACRMLAPQEDYPPLRAYAITRAGVSN